MGNDIEQMIVSTQARIVPEVSTASLLETAKGRAIDATVFDKFEPFFWRSEISSDRVDAYYTVMDAATTLVNFANDAATGVAVLIGHDTRSIPIGSSLTGALDTVGAVTRVLSDAYALIDPSTESIINRVKAGIARDESVGFGVKGAQCICSICGRDMWHDWDCWHMPGFEYEVTTEGSASAVGAKVMTLCTGRIVNARLSEYSLVYDGATPGASVLQAQRMAEAGRLTPQQAQIITQRYRVQLPDKRMQIVVGESRTDLESITVTPLASQSSTAIAPDVRAASGGALRSTKDTSMDPEKELAEQRQTLLDIRAITEKAGAPSDKLLLEQVRWLESERTRLVPLADDGKKYRDDLVADALAEQVRANGTDGEETYRALLTAAPIATIKRMRDDWARIADVNLKGGRQTKDENDGEPKDDATDRTPPAPAVPAALHRVG